MNQKRCWSLLVAGCLLGLLTACGGDSSTGTGLVRVVNATVSHPSLDLLVNAVVTVSGTAKDSASAYAGVTAGSPTLQVNDAGSATVLATIAPTITKDQHASLLVYETSGAIKTTILSDEIAAPTTGYGLMRVFDLAPDAGGLDVYITDPSVTDLRTVSAPTFTLAASTSTQVSSFLSFIAGNYRVRVTGTGDVTDIRLDIPLITLTTQQVDTILLTPTSGGVLVDGGTLAQQGAYSPSRNTNARVRLAVSLTGAGATVAANAGSAVINAATTSPSVGSYAVVPAANALNVSVNGGSVQVPRNVVAGSDSTLLVYGASTAPVVSVIADDNHLPTSTNTLKMRLVNGLTGTVTPLTLTANFGVVASNIAPGSASAYGLVTGGTAVRLDVTTPSGVVPLYTQSALNIPNAEVFSVFVLGDASNPTPPTVVRRDR